MPANTPQELTQLFSQAIGQGDLDAAMALYEPGAVFPNQSGDLRSGADAIRQEMAPFATMKPDLKSNLIKTVIAGDIAVTYHQWTMTTPMQMSGRSVEVARRQPDGTWLLVIDDPFTLGSS